MVRFTLQPLYPWRHSPSYLFARRLSGGSEDGLDAMTKIRIPIRAGIRTSVAEPLSSHFTELLQLAKLYEGIEHIQKETEKMGS